MNLYHSVQHYDSCANTLVQYMLHLNHRSLCAPCVANFTIRSSLLFKFADGIKNHKCTYNVDKLNTCHGILIKISSQ